MASLSDIEFDLKLKENLKIQEEEIKSLKRTFPETFSIEDELEKKCSIRIPLKVGFQAGLEFSFPPAYPSDVPPTYKVNAHWLKEDKMNELLKSLRDIYTRNFGKQVIALWEDKIKTFLKEDLKALRENSEEPVPRAEKKPQAAATPEADRGPIINEGKPIKDRGSTFLPFLAEVYSKDDVTKAIEKIESRRKVNIGWRNTYAYRYFDPKGKIVEVGEDGGEPKAGRNLLSRMIHYKANYVLVYISRRIGDSKLGSGRFKCLNDAADQVLVFHGYKPTNKGQKENGPKSKRKDETINKKDKKVHKKRKY